MRRGRGATAGLALAAASMLYSKLGDRGRGREPLTTAGEADAPAEAVERARNELAEELARRAARSER